MGISEKARLGAKRYFILVPLIIFAVVAVAYFLFSRNKENPPETGNKEETLIEKQLREKNSAWTIENIQKREDFVLFLRGILNLKDLPDPQEMIKNEFEKLIVENNKEYNAEQIKFLRLLEKFLIPNIKINHLNLFSTFTTCEI